MIDVVEFYPEANLPNQLPPAALHRAEWHQIAAIAKLEAKLEATRRRATNTADQAHLAHGRA